MPILCLKYPSLCDPLFIGFYLFEVPSYDKICSCETYCCLKHKNLSLFKLLLNDCFSTEIKILAMFWQGNYGLNYQVSYFSGNESEVHEI